jgi:hypothetical protein
MKAKLKSENVQPVAYQPSFDLDVEHELDCLTKKYERQGFLQYFYLENGLLACTDCDQVLNKPIIKVHEKQYYPKRPGMPHGFCVYTMTVKSEARVFDGIFLLSEGFLSLKEVSKDIDHQLQLNSSYPQIFKRDEN